MYLNRLILCCLLIFFIPICCHLSLLSDDFFNTLNSQRSSLNTVDHLRKKKFIKSLWKGLVEVAFPTTAVHALTLLLAGLVLAGATTVPAAGCIVSQMDLTITSGMRLNIITPVLTDEELMTLIAEIRFINTQRQEYECWARLSLQMMTTIEYCVDHNNVECGQNFSQLRQYT